MNTSPLLESKNLLLNQEDLAELSLNDLQKKVTNKTYIENVCNLLNDISKIFNTDMGINTKTTKMFLSSYLITNHIEQISSNDHYAQKLKGFAQDLLFNLDFLFEDRNTTMKEYNNYMNSLNRYLEFFNVWKKRDGLIMARPVISSYFEYDMLSQNVDNALEEEKMEEDVASRLREKKKDINLIKKKLMQNIRILSGNDGLDYLQRKELPMFNDEQIFSDVEKTVKQAFWDTVKENLGKDDSEQLLQLLGELKGLILETSPNKTQELNEHLDLDLLKQLIQSGSLNTEALKTYTNYIISHIETMQQPSEDENTRMWKENLMNQFDNESRSDALVYFFKHAFEKLEKIKYLTMKIREELAKMKNGQ